jgi:hypothetical protein
MFINFLRFVKQVSCFNYDCGYWVSVNVNGDDGYGEKEYENDSFINFVRYY